MHPKAKKLEHLAEFLDLEAGTVLPEAFTWERQLYSKAVAMKRINNRLRACRLCKGLNCPGSTEVCCGWGDLNSPVVIVGQSAHRYAVRSDLPFILQSGEFMDAACRLSHIRRDRLFITNTVHCHPDSNRASKEIWKESCRPYLKEELEIVQPQAVVALGNDAQYSVGKVWQGKIFGLTHPAVFLRSSAGSDVVINWVLKLSNILDKYYLTNSE